jgi:hypothetical protein
MFTLSKIFIDHVVLLLIVWNEYIFCFCLLAGTSTVSVFCTYTVVLLLLDTSHQRPPLFICTEIVKYY